MGLAKKKKLQQFLDSSRDPTLSLICVKDASIYGRNYQITFFGDRLVSSYVLRFHEETICNCIAWEKSLF